MVEAISPYQAETVASYPAVRPALMLLTGMKANHDRHKEPSPFLFPSRAGDTPQQELKRFWRSVCKAAGIKDAQFTTCGTASPPTSHQAGVIAADR